MNTTWDRLDQLEKTKRESIQQHVIDAFERDVVAPLKNLVAETPANLQAIEEYMPIFVSAIEKAERSRYANDQEILGLLRDMRQTTANSNSLLQGLKRFGELKPQHILLRNGEIDRNAAPNHVDEVKNLLSPGPNCRNGMERAVRRVESRLAYLISTDPTNETPTTSDNAPAVVIAPPEKPAKAMSIETRKEFDVRARR